MENLSTRETIGLSAIGGAIAGIATYPAIDKGYIDLFLRPDTAEWLGFLIRAVGFSGLGAFWGYLHRPDHDRKRVFQLGLLAPAAVVSLIYANFGTGSSPGGNVEPTAWMQDAGKAVAGLGLIGSAHAEGFPDIPITFPTAGPTFVERMIKGAFGR